MNIAVLTTSSRKAGGLFYSVRWLSKALDGQGFCLKVFSPADEYSQQDLCAWDPVPVEFYPAFGPMQSSLRLRRKLKGVGLIHVHGLWLDSQWAAMQYQKKSGIPVIVSPRGMLDLWALENSAWKKLFVEKLFARKALEQATCIHALCQSEAESIRSYGLKNPIAIIPNGVKLPSLQTLTPPQSETAVRQERGGKFQIQRKKLLFLGRIHPKKGLSELLEGWAKAQCLNPKIFSEWHLLIAGWDDGGHEQGLKALASRLGVGDSVSFIGAQYGEKKEQVLRSADAFILPSFSEGLPMSVLEAWSYQLPVVMTGFCNIPEGFETNAAIRIEPNSKSIADGLLMLVDLSNDDLESMGINGRNLVEQRFTWSRIADNMRWVYEWCLTGANPPECMEFSK